MTEIEADLFDEQRRAWIRAHPAGNIQRRREQVLGQRIARRQRVLSGVGADPADDSVLPPLWSRKPAVGEAVAVGVAGVLAPLGWAAGWLLYRRVAAMVADGEIPAVPVAASLWAAVVTGVLSLALYSPGGSIASTLGGAWVVAQVPAAFAAAAVIAVADGWLAVSAGWWPPDSAAQPRDLAQELGFGPPAQDGSGSLAPVVWGAAVCLLGVAWTVAGVVASLASL